MSSSVMPRVAAFAAVLALAGCTASAVPPTSPTLPQPDCGATALQSKIGQPVTGSTASDVLVGGQPVQSQGVVRVIGPGQPYTQDYSAARLNIFTTTAGTLERANCG